MSWRTYEKKTEVLWGRRNSASTPPSDLSCNITSSLGLQPASLPCRFWTCQPLSFLSQFLKRNPFLAHSFSLSLFPLGKNIYWFVCLFPTGSISLENSDWQKHYISMYYYIITVYFIILDIFVRHLNFPLDYDINFYPRNTANHIIGITLPLLKCKTLRTKTVSIHLYIPIANCRWSINIFE